MPDFLNRFGFSIRRAEKMRDDIQYLINEIDKTLAPVMEYIESINDPNEQIELAKRLPPGWHRDILIAKATRQLIDRDISDDSIN